MTALAQPPARTPHQPGSLMQPFFFPSPYIHGPATVLRGGGITAVAVPSGDGWGGVRTAGCVSLHGEVCRTKGEWGSRSGARESPCRAWLQGSRAGHAPNRRRRA